MFHPSLKWTTQHLGTQVSEFFPNAGPLKNTDTKLNQDNVLRDGKRNRTVGNPLLG